MLKRLLSLSLIAVFLLILIPAHTARAATRTVCAIGCDHTTIPAAIAAAAAGDTISVGAGTYANAATIVVDKYLIINGAGAGTTIVNGVNPVFSYTAGGTSAANRAILSGMTITGTGVGINLGTNNFITLDNLLVTNNPSYGLTYTTVNDLIIQNSTFSFNLDGMRLGSGAGSDGLLITNSHFDNNTFAGLEVYNAASNASVFTNITIRDTTFNNNPSKGIYLEKLSNALFERITVDNSGVNNSYAFNNGIDINLKYDPFSNIIIRDSVISNSGVFKVAHVDTLDYSAGIAIKARSDAPSYNTNPATLSNVTLSGLTISGTDTGIRFGEPNKNLPGVTNAIVEYSRIIATPQGLENATQAAITAINNWWGCNAGPGTTGCGTVDNTTTGVANFSPWLMLTLDPLAPMTCAADNLTQTITANLVVNSAGSITGTPFLPDGIPVAFSVSAGTISPTSGSTIDGKSSATWNIPGAVTATVDAKVDNQTVTGSLLAPADCTPVVTTNGGAAPEVAAAPTFTDSAFLTKSVDKTIAQVGDTLTFVINYGNPKGITLNNVVIADTFDSRLTNIQVVSSSLGTPVVSGNSVTLQGISLLPGQRATLTITARISSAAKPGDTISNTVSLESPDASIHFSNVTLTTILPGALPATGASPLSGVRLPLLALLLAGGLILLRRRLSIA